MSRDCCSLRLTRREALGVLGLGAASLTLGRVALGAEPAFPPGAVIRTVLRDYAPEELAGGATLFHEHLSLEDDFMTRWNAFSSETRRANALPRERATGERGQRGAARRGATRGEPAQRPAGTRRGASNSEPNGVYFMRDVELMADEMRIAKREGIGCIVDGGHPDMGRNIEFLRQVSTRSGMPIVAGGGFYTQPFYPPEIASLSEEQIVEALVKQAETDLIGAYGEIGSWDDMTRDERKVFRAVGKAHLTTNLPIFTHTGIPGKAALEQLDILEDAGVDPRRVVIGHLNNLVDENVQVQRAICRRGAFVGFDRQGGRGDADVVPMAMTLIDAGYADNLLFASDLSSAAALKRNGGAGYAKTLTVFVPKLKAAGASDEVLRKITHDNPRRFLAFTPKKPRQT